MNFEIGTLYHGFKLLKERKIKEINSTGRIFLHQKSGAHLLHLENDDDNKVFSVSFRTPPRDSTGIPHILEHSVLCGSKKFPLKEPFVELVKGSLNTFLNAMTFPDKTMYPVASRNKKDFYNLMNVYMDAVFHPNIYEYPEILMQEGWHYELDSVDSEISYKGVVYNEMKGFFSSPESILFQKIFESLFPDTCYGLESGGDPDLIPQLTRDEFLNFHRQYYHPANSYFYLYGDGDILEQLEFIDREYLNAFEKISVDSSIPSQEPFSKLQEVITEYPITPEEEEADKSYLSINYVIGSATDPELYLAFDMLEHLLLETPAAPLKKALIDAQIGKDVFGQFEPSMLQPIFSIVVKNSNEQKKDDFQNVVFKVLEKLTRDGIDKKLIQATINIKEFSLREADFRGFPKGLVYCIQSMDSWLYDADPFLHLEYEPALRKIKTALRGSYFEELIDRYILRNNHSTIVIVKPQKGLSEKKAKAVQARLKDYKKSISMDELQNIVQGTEALKKRQMIPDPPEALRVIPLLTLGDINPEAEKLPLEEKKERGRTVLFHPIFTNKIVYLNLFFDIHVTEEKLPYVTLLSHILGKISTEKYHYAELSNEINIHTGGISFSPETYGDKERDNLFYPKFQVKSKTLTSKLSHLSNLIGEILGHTRFDDKKRLKEIIQEAKSRMEMSIYESGHLIAASRLLSYFSSIGRYAELLSGLSFYKFIAEVEREFDQKADELINRLNETASDLFREGQLLVSITAEKEDYDAFKKNFPVIIEHLGRGKSEEVSFSFSFGVKNEGLLTPAKVQYVAKGYNFKKLGHMYDGSLQVLRTITSMDYLWNRVRVQGGAYGSFARFARNGNMYFCSYRDPNLKETLSVYNHADEYLGSFEPDIREMTKYIIGTISKMDSPLTPSMKGEVATEHYFSNITQEDIQKTRDEVLHTGKSDIKRFAEMIRDVMGQDYYCVIGSDVKIKESEEIFQSLVSVFEG